MRIDATKEAPVLHKNPAPAQPRPERPKRPKRPTTPTTPSTGYRVAAVALFAATVITLGVALLARHAGGNPDVPFALAVLAFIGAVITAFMHDRRVKAQPTATAKAGR